MFDSIMGVPAHPLIVHAAVVFIPLLVLAGLVYVLVPKFRAKISWAVVGLAVVAPIAALLAKLSGDALERMLIEKNYPEEILSQVTQHSEYGDLTFWVTLALGLVTLALTFVTSARGQARGLPTWLGLVLSILVVVLAVVTAIYAFLTGDSGAKAVWSGF